MAKYIVLNSKFEPLSFADRIAPYKDYYEKAYTQQEELANLELAASTLEDMLKDERDSALKNQYQEYIDSLYTLRDRINTMGIDNNIVNDSIAAKANYNANIVPIMTAQQRRQTAIDSWLKDPTSTSRYIGNTPMDTSITDWMHNATPNIFGVSGANVAAQAKTLATNISNGLIDTSDINKITKGIHPSNLINIINAQINGRDDTLTAKEKHYKQYIDNIINTVQNEFGYGSLGEDFHKKFMNEVYTGILEGTVYQEEAKKTKTDSGSGSGIDLSKLKTAPLDVSDLLSPNINNANTFREFVAAVYPGYEHYIGSDGSIVTNFDDLKGSVQQSVAASIITQEQNKYKAKLRKENPYLSESELLIQSLEYINDVFGSSVGNSIWGSSSISQKVKDIYNSNAEEAKKILKNINRNDITRSYTAPFHMIKLDNSKEVASRILNMAANNAGDENLSIRRIKQFKPETSEDGSVNENKLVWEFDEGREIELDDFEWTEDGTELAKEPIFYRSTIESDNPGYVMQLGGTSYFIPSALFGSSEQTEAYLRQANKEKAVYEDAENQLMRYAETKGYLQTDPITGQQVLSEAAQTDLQLLLLYELANQAKNTYNAALTKFINNAANIGYTVKSPVYTIE